MHRYAYKETHKDSQYVQICIEVRYHFSVAAVSEFVIPLLEIIDMPKRGIEIGRIVVYDERWPI